VLVGVDRRLGHAPVVLGAPVLDEPLEVAALDAVVTVRVAAERAGF
jgi:hypothetical protein